VSPVRYELGFYILEDVLHSHGSENLKSYTVTGMLMQGVLSDKRMGLQITPPASPRQRSPS
jgi:hypothetical protein